MPEAAQPIAFEVPELAKEKEAAAREAVFAALVGRQARFVFRVAYAILRNTEDAEDAAQETFLKIYRGGAWEGLVEERAFLARVAWHAAIDRLPKVRNTPLEEQMWADSGRSPEETAITADRHATVNGLIASLPEELRQPLALSTVEEMSSREIAQAMGIAEGTVRTRLMRARQILRQKLAAMMEGRYGR